MLANRAPSWGDVRRRRRMLRLLPPALIPAGPVAGIVDRDTEAFDVEQVREPVADASADGVRALAHHPLRDRGETPPPEGSCARAGRAVRGCCRAPGATNVVRMPSTTRLAAMYEGQSGSSLRREPWARRRRVRRRRARRRRSGGTHRVSPSRRVVMPWLLACRRQRRAPRRTRRRGSSPPWSRACPGCGRRMSRPARESTRAFSSLVGTAADRPS